nr:MAG TPA_asm: hypothetical protein [Caudoviricetes sp.]
MVRRVDTPLSLPRHNRQVVVGIVGHGFRITVICMPVLFLRLKIATHAWRMLWRLRLPKR